MANNQKKYASLGTLSTLVDNIKNLFATKSDLNTGLSSKADKSHTHSIGNVTNLQSTLDSKVPTTRTINNKSLSANITLSASDIGAASSTHDHNSVYYTQSQVDTKLSGKSDKTHNHDSDYADIDHNHDGVYAVEGHNHDNKYDAKGTASSTVSTHNTATDTHNDIRLSITELTTKLNNFLDVDDATTDQLSELLTLIENNATDIESITNGKVNVSDIIDNLTTNVANKPLSAAQGVVIQKLISDLQVELDSHKHTVSEISDLTATATELNYMDGVTSNVQAQLDSKAESSHNHSAYSITSGILPVKYGGTGNSNGYVRAGAEEGSTIGALATAEGRKVTASGSYSHAEGNYTEASGSSAHAEGQSSTASGIASHAEGNNATASGNYSHAEGDFTNASAKGAHVEGTYTLASSDYQHVQGKFNIEDKAGVYAHIVGNGTGTSNSSRSNAHTIDWDGNAWFAGDIFVGGTSQTSGAIMLSSIATVTTAEYEALEEAEATNANTLYMLTDAEEEVIPQIQIITWEDDD